MISFLPPAEAVVDEGAGDFESSLRDQAENPPPHTSVCPLM